MLNTATWFNEILSLLVLMLFWPDPAYNQASRHSIFNGKDLAGWTKVGEAPFDVLDHSIVLHQKAYTKEHSFLRTNKKYRNFILELDARRDSLFYYGILFRAIKAPDTAHVRLYGYQIKVDHIPTRRWTGGIYDDFGNTWNWLYPLTDNIPAQNALKPPGAWDHYKIEALGDRIRTWVNGVPAADLINRKYRKGYIALKIHQLGGNKAMELHTGWIKDLTITTRSIKKQVKTNEIIH
jgi:hypothetical protein